MPNFTTPTTVGHQLALVTPDGSHGFRVQAGPQLWGFTTRATVVDKGLPMLFLLGDGMEVPDPLVFTAIVEGATFQAAQDRIATLLKACKAATHLRLVGVDVWWTLQEDGLALRNFVPVPMNTAYTAYSVRVELLPKFARAERAKSNGSYIPITSSAITSDLTAEHHFNADGDALTGVPVMEYGPVNALETRATRVQGFMSPESYGGGDATGIIQNVRLRVPVRADSGALPNGPARNVLAKFHGLCDLIKGADNLDIVKGNHEVTRRLYGDGMTLAAASLEWVGPRDAVATFEVRPLFATETTDFVLTLSQYEAAVAAAGGAYDTPTLTTPGNQVGSGAFSSAFSSAFS